ncbi:bone morphogenetic protein receptor type-1B-like [Patiria miniata]|uniref:receptor protein serine/threonine kinase n=1 Tax=Patiria miniata TaxID=46514 RepID=A0A914ABQ8_PATMI|nr:bone morphogenetic protein receptor type-1B-like [Patiria miniata]
MKCYCSEHCPEDAPNNTCILRPGGWCFSQIQAGEDGVIHEGAIASHGCLAPMEDGGLFQCKGKAHTIPRIMMCCNDKPMCNLGLSPTLAPTTTADIPVEPLDQYEYDTAHQIVLLVSVTICAVLFILTSTFLYIRLKKREARRRFDVEVSRTRQNETYITDGESLSELLNRVSGSGSGSGLPLLVQRTIAKQVQLIRCVGQGRFGEVWKAKWRGEHVAVKIYLTEEESSWFRETEIYQTVLMRHDNILGFIAADIRGSGSWTQLFLITEYHEHGALFNYLRYNILDTKAMLLLAHSAANGLAHLHSEICGMQGKPAIAHRDINSRNVLVRANGTCAIGDMSRAARFLSETNEVDLPTKSRTGNRRYMAPEVLDGTINVNAFESYKNADVYSFGLVLWEIARRCVTRGIVEDAQVPYHDFVPSSNPTYEEMQKVVIQERRRPDIPNRWSGDDSLLSIARVMTQCWHPNPAARLTMLRVKKTLAKMQEEDFKV